MNKSTGTHETARDKILSAALTVIRTNGYTATTVDKLCQAAGVTKGAFFHHFKSKEALAVAAVDHWSVMTSGFFAMQAYRQLDDPLDRLIGYVEFRKAILQGELPEYTCLVGTMVQETYDSAPLIRAACMLSITEHAGVVEKDIAAAMKQYKMKENWSAKSLALYTQAVIQGSFILAKATRKTSVAADCIDHLHRYISMLFVKPAIIKSKKGK